ncbi:hypothetical protein ACXPGF_001733, partial [Escherichia coli]
MASLDDKSLFEDIFRLENDTPAEAIGPEGDISFANLQAQQLANRTRWLRMQLLSISDFREYTFFKTAEDPDGTIAGRANTPDGKLFRVSQGDGDALAFKYYLHKDGVAIPDTTLIGIGSIKNTIRVFPTLAVAQADADAGNITSGSTAYYRSPDDSALAIEVVNNGGTLEPTGRKIISKKYVDDAIAPYSPLLNITQASEFFSPDEYKDSGVQEAVVDENKKILLSRKGVEWFFQKIKTGEISADEFSAEILSGNDILISG